MMSDFTQKTQELNDVARYKFNKQKISSFPKYHKSVLFQLIYKFYPNYPNLLKSRPPENIYLLNPDLLILKLIMENIEDHSEDLWWKICHV